MPNKALDYMEEKRLKGIAVTGRELKGKFGQKEVDVGLVKQRKKLHPPKPSSDEEIMESQSKMRKMFNKKGGY